VARKWAFACVISIFFTTWAVAQKDPPAPAQARDKSAQAPPPANQDDSANDGLREEDESLKPKIYPFNPLEAERNVKVGNFYMRQGDARGYRAAAGRFEDATKYNPGSGEAFFRLGEAEEKLKHSDKAKAAFARVLKVAPDSKLAKDAKKKLASLE
jgi:TolA-binding protein